MYYIIFLIGVILIFLPKYHKISAFIFTAFLLILALFRYGVGNDFFAYKYLYNIYTKTILYEINHPEAREEILFRIITTIFNNLDFSYLVYLSFYSIISLYCIYKVCIKYSIHAQLSMLTFYSFFYFVWIFSGIRQGIAIAVGILLVLYCFENKKNVLFVFLISILSLVHSSAIVLIFLYFLAKLNWKKTQLFFIFIISLIISILPVNFLTVLTLFSDRINSYKINENIISLDFQSIIRILLVTTVFVFYRQIKKINEIHYFILKFYILGICLYFLFKDIELVAARLSIYSRVLEMILIPAILYVINKKYVLITLVIIILLITISFNKELIGMGENAIYNSSKWYVPYTNIFNKNEYDFINRT
ncbi:EpsG family protein [Staphylococcus xylosus]|uniref:EpsG family protein n=1 Tax=Staphylococcus xylosus TaxID=1288 RepID=UPI002DBA0068|nr:EpsG family protein [Staphylococcus xylosus]MEB8121490.1 EpsG family protein [Staphylococcus xylosus]